MDTASQVHGKSDADARPGRADQMRKVKGGQVFTFRVVDQDGAPAAGVPVLLLSTTQNPLFPIVWQPFNTERQELTTNDSGVVTSGTMIGANVRAVIATARLEHSLWMIPPEEMVVNAYAIKAGRSPEQAGIPADRRPQGYDYEFRIIRYPSQGIVAHWRSVVVPPLDGSWVPWNPLAEVRISPGTTMTATPLTLPAIRPELSVSLWRDPAVPMKSVTPYRHSQGFDDIIEKTLPVHWRLAVRAHRGDLRSSTWQPLRPVSTYADVFPIIDQMPTDGFTTEITWDVPEPDGAQRQAWNRPIPMYWRRPGMPNLTIQVILTPRYSMRDGTKLAERIHVRNFDFKVEAEFRVRLDGGTSMVLSPEARPNVGDVIVQGNYPQWYRWADRDLLAGLLASPLPP